MENELLQKLVDKSLTKTQLLQEVRQDYGLLPAVLEGTFSSKAAIRYGCAKVLMDLSEEDPENLYPHMDFFIDLLDSKYRILTWNALTIIANLAKVDKNGKLEAAFTKYFSFINDHYMITVANVVGNSGKIALAKPHLIEKITNELLKVESLPATPHLTKECKRVIAEAAIKSFNLFFDKIKEKKRVISFVNNYRDSSRKTLRDTAVSFLDRWDNPKLPCL
jgi:hypothetical protein